MNSDVTRRTLLAGAAGLATATAGCVGGGERDESETIEETYAVEDVTALTVDGHSGVSVRAEGRDDVAVTGEKRAASEGGLDDVRLVAEREDDALALRVERDDGPFVVRFGPGPTMDLTVRVPSDLPVERVETPNGNVAVTDVRGGLALDVVNGDVTASGVRGDLTVDTTNGDVLARGVAGDVTVEGGNGDVEIAAADGDVDVETTNGEVTIGVSGDVDATFDIDTANGDVTITGVGDLSGAEEFPVTVGDGRREIAVTTTNGDVLVRGS